MHLNLEFSAREASPLAFACPVCAEHGPKQPVLSVGNVHAGDEFGSTLHLYRCPACLSLCYNPFPAIDYTQHTSADLSVRDYVEFNAAIDLIARNILRAIPDQRRPGRLLDIGCGYGFGLDAIRAITGWQVKGFEPSHYGKLGREQLGLDIVGAFAAKNEAADDVYDIVHCSEVIEHVHEPHAFIDILQSYLADDGVLILTTPDAHRIQEGGDRSALLSLLSPGAHTILFSDQALVAALKTAGLPHVEVDRSAASMLVYASRVPLRLRTRPQDELAGMLHRYLAEALGRAAPGSSLEIGLRYRLFRGAMDSGHYALAETAFSSNLSEADPVLDDIATPEQFAARWPLCIAASTYYLAMLMLIHRGDYLEAARHFRAAARLCRTKIGLSAATAVVESDLIWRAAYHEALAYSYAGAKLRALATLAGFVDLAQDASPPVPKDLHAAVSALREQLAGEALA